MNKTHKKIENTLRKALTEVCETALEDVAGFKWITHFVNYSSFPASLIVVCVFDTDNALSGAVASQEDNDLRSIIKRKLNAENIHIEDVRQQVKFDTEEACERENGGKWHDRYS
jgi:hypothetical protein